MKDPRQMADEIEIVGKEVAGTALLRNVLARKILQSFRRDLVGSLSLVLAILGIIVSLTYWEVSQQSRLAELEKEVEKISREKDDSLKEKEILRSEVESLRSDIAALRSRSDNLSRWMKPLCDELDGSFDLGSLTCSAVRTQKNRR